MNRWAFINVNMLVNIYNYGFVYVYRYVYIYVSIYSLTINEASQQAGQLLLRPPLPGASEVPAGAFQGPESPDAPPAFVYL